MKTRRYLAALILPIAACSLLPIAMQVHPSNHLHPTHTEVDKDVCTPTCYPKLAIEPIKHCGTDETIGCEEGGSETAFAINVIHYRIEEAKTAQHDGHTDVCTKAAFVAAAFATGLPEFRDVRRKEKRWVDNISYQTRWDDTLSEDALFAKARSSEQVAEKLYNACGGEPMPDATPKDKFAFAPEVANEVATAASPCITYQVAVCEQALDGMWGSPEENIDAGLLGRLAANAGVATPTACSFPPAPRVKKGWIPILEVVTAHDGLGRDDLAFVASNQLWSDEDLEARYRCVIADVYRHNHLR
jgi:hypothetical protein